MTEPSNFNWATSEFITSNDFYSLTSDIDATKLEFRCALCPAVPGVIISAGRSSSANLRKHFVVSLYILRVICM